MDWLAALCLSVPPSFALVAATWIARDALHSAVLTFGRNLNDGLVAVASRMEDAITTAAAEIGQAHVRAAKYQSRAITVKPKPQEPAEPTTFERWMALEGHKFPQTVQDQVEWAIGRLKGEESDDEGDESAARVILRQYAGWVERVVDDEVRKAATAK